MTTPTDQFLRRHYPNEAHDATDDDFDQNGILKDGRRIRVPLTMMDSNQRRSTSSPMIINTGLPLRGKDSLARHFYRDGTPKHRTPRARHQPVADAETFDASPHRPGFCQANDAARAKVDEAYNEMVRDACSAWRGSQAVYAETISSHRPGWRGVSDAAPTEADKAYNTMVADMCSAWQRDSQVASPPVTTNDAGRPDGISDGEWQRALMIREMTDAWKPRDALPPGVGQPTRTAPNRPDGAYAPVGLGANEGDTVTFNGAPARLVRRGEWLFAEVINVGPSRSSAPANRSAGDSRLTADMGVEQRTAYSEYLRDLENAWRS